MKAKYGRESPEEDAAN